MERLLAGLLEAGIPAITLYADPKVVTLYEKLGFARDPQVITHYQSAAGHMQITPELLGTALHCSGNCGREARHCSHALC